MKYMLIFFTLSICNTAYCNNNSPNTPLSVKENNESRNHRQYATQYIIKQAEAGDMDFQLELAKRYTEGVGIEKDYKKAIFWLEKSAEQKQLDALFYLGWIYLHGKGVNKNKNTALHWLEQAAEKNDAYAQYLTGRIYEENTEGNPISSDISKSQYWYNRSCKNYIILGCEGEKRLKKVMGNPPERQGK